MNLLKNILGIKDQSTFKDDINNTLAAVEISHNKPFQNQYFEVIVKNMNNYSPGKVLTQLIIQLSNAIKPNHIIKLLTIILKFLRFYQYDQQIILVIQNISFTQNKVNQINNIWVNQLKICFWSFIIRLPSLNQLNLRCIAYNYRNQFQPKYMMIDLYRLINTISLLFPYINNSINIVGRYKQDQIKSFGQFYIVLRQQFTYFYNYLQHINSYILLNYKLCKKQDLVQYIKLIPNLELLCDKLEQFFMNKYFRGPSLLKKLYVKFEHVEQIQYFLSQDNNNNPERLQSIIIK